MYTNSMKVLTAILIYASIDSKINEPIPKAMAKSNLPFFLRTRPHPAEALHVVVHVYSTAASHSTCTCTSSITECSGLVLEITP